MRRKNKKISKITTDKPSTESETTSSEKICNDRESISSENSSSKIKRETIETSVTDADSDNNLNSDLNVQSIKLEKLDDFQSIGEASKSSKIDSISDTNSLCDMATESEATFLFIELRLISVDQKCQDYKKLRKKFLCVSSSATVDHLQQLIYKKMKLPENCFEILLMCNGFEVKCGCPLLFLKNKFFNNEERIVVYYAIVENQNLNDTPCLNESINKLDIKQIGIAK